MNVEKRNLYEISIVIPSYRPTSEFRRLMIAISEDTWLQGHKYEVIIVNDSGDDDHSALIIKSSIAFMPAWKVVTLARNSGQQAATIAGIGEAKGTIILTMDDDGQHSVKSLRRLHDKAMSGFDVVYGNLSAESHPRARSIFANIVKGFGARLFGNSDLALISSFRAIKNEAWIIEGLVNNQITSLDAYVMWVVSKIGFVAVDGNRRLEGISGYTFWTLLKHSLNMYMDVLIIPLRMVLWLSAIISVTSTVLLAGLLINFLIYGVTVPGFFFVSMSICAFASTQLFAIGILAEYISRIYLGVSRRPVFVVKKLETNVQIGH